MRPESELPRVGPVRHKVHVLLATYNGEQYLEQQIDSILTQEGIEVHLTVADDGSTDRTMDILRAAERAGDLRILTDEPTGNFVLNFARLMESVPPECDFFALSDQDDIWSPRKLERLVGELQARPHRAVAFSDMAVVGADLSRRPARGFLCRRLRREPAKNEVAVQNWISGNASLFRKRVLESALPIPEGVISHDWWLAFCAVSQGGAAYVDEQLVLYRQHNTNVEGAKRSILLRILTAPRDSSGRFSAKLRQLDAFAIAATERGLPVASGLSLAAAASHARSAWSRVRMMHESGVRYADPFRYLLHLLLLAYTGVRAQGDTCLVRLVAGSS